MNQPYRTPNEAALALLEQEHQFDALSDADYDEWAESLTKWITADRLALLEEALRRGLTDRYAGRGFRAVLEDFRDEIRSAGE